MESEEATRNGIMKKVYDITKTLSNDKRKTTTAVKDRCGNVLDLARFKKIAIKGKGPDGNWTRKPLAYRESNIFNLCVIRPPEICVKTLHINIFTQLAVTQSMDNLLHSLNVLCENEYFLISNLH